MVLQSSRLDVRHLYGSMNRKDSPAKHPSGHPSPAVKDPYSMSHIGLLSSWLKPKTADLSHRLGLLSDVKSPTDKRPTDRPSIVNSNLLRPDASTTCRPRLDDPKTHRFFVFKWQKGACSRPRDSVPYGRKSNRVIGRGVPCKELSAPIALGESKEEVLW